MDSSIINIMDDFELDLKLIEDHLEMYTSTIEKKNITIIDKVNLLRDRAIIDFIKQNDVKNKMYSEKLKAIIIEITDKILKKDTIAKRIYKSFTVEFSDEKKDTLNIKTSAPATIMTLFDREDNNEEESTIYGNKTVLYNLCSSIEHVFAKVLKDFYLYVDKSDRLDGLSIKLEDLKKIDKVKDAEELLIEKVIEKKFFDSFNTWYDKIEEEIRFEKYIKKPYVKEELKQVKEFISEMFLIRNLYIHNRGIVNDKFKNLTKLNQNVDKGRQYPLTEDFVSKCITNTRNLIYYFIYYYSFSKYKNKHDIIERIFSNLNSIFLKHIKSDIPSVGTIFNLISENDKIDNELKSIAKINYYIFKYYNHDFTECKKELQSLILSSDDFQFIMAKKILLQDEEAYNYIVEFLNNEEDDYIFSIYDWPLMKIAMENDSSVKKLFKKRFDDILNDEDEGIDNKEENYYGYKKEKGKKINRYKNKIKKWWGTLK